MLLSTRRFRPSGPWCFAVSQPPARTSLWSCFEGMGAALWSWFLVGSEGNVKCPQARSVLQGHGVLLFRNRPLGLCCGAALRAWELHFGAAESNVRHQLRQHHQQQQEEQQQQQAQQLQSLCFYQNPEGTSSPGIACFWKSFRPSGPWCFAVSQPPARTLLWSCFEGMGAALQKATLGTSSSSSTTSSRAAAAGPAAAIALFLPESRRDVKPRDSMFFGGRSVLQGHGVLLFRNRPLGLCCGAALRAWELHFGAGFLSVQKATLGTSSSSTTSSSSRSSSRPSSCNPFVFTRIQKGRQAPGQHVFGGRSVLQGHGVLLFRNRPLGLCCGAALRAWELHFGAGFLSVQKATL